MGGQLVAQATGVLATLIYTAIATFVILKAVDFAIGLRVSDEEEAMGLDVALHNERGYDI